MLDQKKEEACKHIFNLKAEFMKIVGHTFKYITGCAFWEAQYHQVNLDLHENLEMMLEAVFVIYLLIGLMLIVDGVVRNQLHALDHEIVL